MKPPKVDLKNLSAQERLKLLGEIWDSLTDSPERLPLTPAQLSELDRRLDDFEGDTVQGIPWDDVIERIRRRAG